MVHDNKSPRKPSPVRSRTTRSSLRYTPTARQSSMTKDTSQNNLRQGSCSTIYTLHIPEQAHLSGLVNNPTTPISTIFLNSLSASGSLLEIKGEASTAKSKNVILDKVEDMDIDHQSDHEKECLDSEMMGTACGSGLQTSSQATKGSVGESKTEKKIKKGLKQVTQANEKEKLHLPSKGKKNSFSEIGHGSKMLKKKPIYIILHAALIRIGGKTGKALSPIRIQAEKIIAEIELKSGPIVETLNVRIPFKELAAVQANLSEPPYLLVIFINENYSQSHSFTGSKKNAVLNKIKGFNKVVIQLTYDSIPKDVKQDLDMLRLHLSPDVQWKEISSSQATDAINGKDDTDCTDAQKKNEIQHGKERKILKGQGNKKEIEITSQANEAASQVAKVEKETSPVKHVKTTIVSPESVANPRRKRKYHETTALETDSCKLEEKVEPEPEKDETSNEKCQHSEIASETSLSEREQVERTGSFSFIHYQERSFEENREEARRISELQASVTEKERLLSQRSISLELKELQLEQERNTVRELRGSLREDQTTRRDLEARFDVVNGELLSRNSRDRVENARMEEMGRELSQLNVSLNEVRRDNQSLRDRVEECDTALVVEQSTVISLEEDLERERTTLETLRGDVRRREHELREEQSSRVDALDMRNQIERTLTSTTQEYEQRIRRSVEERTRIDRQYDECNRVLETTREELHDTNSALHRAQETIEEYSRMQPRDWTILRDEIEISENILGQGAWGWVKEGTFRGTKVAIKQMHELIISPHNRRLFEREMHMAARCRHPNLLQFIGATNDNGLALLITELLDTNLRTVLGQRSLCHDEVLTLSVDVARALNYLHLNKPFPIMHRDISSTNVLLWRREDVWHAKLSDYGAANFMRQCMTTSPGALIYAAPEAMTSQQSTKVDVFSFGLLLCEMCIRELPVPDHTNDQIRLITNGHLRDLVQRCTNTTAENRPTMQEALSALGRLCSNTTLGMVSLNNRQVVL